MFTLALHHPQAVTKFPLQLLLPLNESENQFVIPEFSAADVMHHPRVFHLPRKRGEIGSMPSTQPQTIRQKFASTLHDVF